MNIIYKLSFIDKQDNPKYYIGCKAECAIQNIDGIPTMVSLKDNRPYYGSATSKIFQEDFKKYKLTAEVLEEVKNRDNLLVKEHHYLTSLDCANSDEYYNLSNGIPRTTSYVPVNPDKVINIYGETVRAYNGSKTAIAKRDNTAVKLGYKDFSQLAFFIYDQISSGTSGPDLGKILGKERHFGRKFISLWDMKKAKEDCKLNLGEEVRTMYSKGASLHHISESLNIELPSARYFLSNFKSESLNTVASKLNKSSDEFTTDILEKIGKEKLPLQEVAKHFGITTQAVYRYVERYIQSLY